MNEVGGQRAAFLDRRYGRRGIEVLDRLREAKNSRGSLAQGDVNRVAVELGLPRAHVNGAASFYSDLSQAPHGRRRLRVCVGTACLAATQGTHLLEAAHELGIEPGTMRDDGSVSIEPVYCLGYCYGGPAALEGERPLSGTDLLDQLAGRAERVDPPIPFVCATPEPVVLAGLFGVGPTAWTVWADMVSDPDGPRRVVTEVTAAGLRGRGGAEFPAATKWTAAAQTAPAGPRYVIANGDEGDPGSYIDRLLLERDPHRVLEGLALAGLASRASQGYVYVRSEYPVARDAVREAVVQARAAGHLGRDIHGSGVDFDVEVFEGAGSYVAGEETSLIRSMEGLRGNAVARPPYPTEEGLFGAPTVVNNVETLASVPWVLANGGPRFARMGTPDSPGTKVICLNERFVRPGAYEVEFGTTVRHVVEELGGGLRDGHELRALQVGGPLGTLLTPDQLDLEIGFAPMDRAGAPLGHGGLVAIDERMEFEDLLAYAWRFAVSESCGACAPCRVGTKRGQELATSTRGRRLHPDEEARREALFEAMRQGSLCGFGRSVPSAVEGVMRFLGGSAAGGTSGRAQPR